MGDEVNDQNEEVKTALGFAEFGGRNSFNRSNPKQQCWTQFFSAMKQIYAKQFADLTSALTI